MLAYWLNSACGLSTKSAHWVLTCEVWPIIEVYGNKASTKFSIKIIHKNAKLPSTLCSLFFSASQLPSQLQTKLVQDFYVDNAKISKQQVSNCLNLNHFLNVSQTIHFDETLFSPCFFRSLCIAHRNLIVYFWIQLDCPFRYLFLLFLSV